MPCSRPEVSTLKFSGARRLCAVEWHSVSGVEHRLEKFCYSIADLQLLAECVDLGTFQKTLIHDI